MTTQPASTTAARFHNSTTAMGPPGRHTCAVLMLLVVGCLPRNVDDADEEKDEVPGTSAPFFLPTTVPDNTAAPAIAVDQAGGTHAVYPVYAGGDAYYAYCPGGCRSTDEVSVVQLPTSGTVSNAMLALDAGGHPQILLSAYAGVYYASCDGDCRDQASWTTTRIIEHGGDQQVTGEALALDGEGRPRFVLHTTVAYLGVGQKPPATHWATCDAACDDPSAWEITQISDQIWRTSSLRFDVLGRAHVATAALVTDANGTGYVGAYLRCDGGCENGNAWFGQGLATAHEAPLAAVPIEPAVSLALTSDGEPRIALMSEDDYHQRRLTYWACSGDCTNSPWDGMILSEGNAHGAGVDLALDEQGRPVVAHTVDYGIVLARCDADACAEPNAPWQLERVEAGSEMAPDTFYLYPNCVVSAWFLHSPSVAFAPTGTAHVGYQARDISGGLSNPDPDDTPDCVAGTDMTWSRLALLPGG